MDLWAPDHRVVQGCDADHAGRGLLEKLELLAAHRGQVEEEAGNVAAGAGETRDEAARYRIGLEVDGHDGQGTREGTRGGETMGAADDDNVHVGLEYGIDRGAVTLHPTFRPAMLDDDRLPRYVAGVAQPLQEGLERSGPGADEPHARHARLGKSAAGAGGNTGRKRDQETATIHHRVIPSGHVSAARLGAFPLSYETPPRSAMHRPGLADQREPFRMLDRLHR